MFRSSNFYTFSFLSILSAVSIFLTGCSSVPSHVSSENFQPLAKNTIPFKLHPGHFWQYVTGGSGCLDRLCVSAKICIKTTCEVVDNLLLDTGSVGLKVKEGAFSQKMKRLLKETEFTVNGQVITEKASYSGGDLFGPVNSVSVQVGSYQNKTVNVLVINRTSVLSTYMNLIRVNGILGVASNSNGGEAFSWKNYKEGFVSSEITRILLKHDSVLPVGVSYVLSIPKKGPGQGKLVLTDRSVVSCQKYKQKFGILDTGMPNASVVFKTKNSKTGPLYIVGLPRLKGHTIVYSPSYTIFKKACYKKYKIYK